MRGSRPSKPMTMTFLMAPSSLLESSTNELARSEPIHDSHNAFLGFQSQARSAIRRLQLSLQEGLAEKNRGPGCPLQPGPRA